MRQHLNARKMTYLWYSTVLSILLCEECTQRSTRREKYRTCACSVQFLSLFDVAAQQLRSSGCRRQFRRQQTPRLEPSKRRWKLHQATIRAVHGKARANSHGCVLRLIFDQVEMNLKSTSGSSFAPLKLPKVVKEYILVSIQDSFDMLQHCFSIFKQIRITPPDPPMFRATSALK